MRLFHWVKRLPGMSYPVGRILWTVGTTLVLCALSLLILVTSITAGMKDITEDSIHSDAKTATPHLTDFDCILVLGAGVRADGTASPMLADRVKVAVDLYEATGLPLLMSGDHTGDYNEVAVMKALAVEAGVPAEDVFLDHAGYSTYESLYRAKEMFGARKVAVVSQGYHLYRALFIARECGLEAVGVPSDLRDYYLQTRYELRELLARVKDFYVACRGEVPCEVETKVDLSGDGNNT